MLELQRSDTQTLPPAIVLAGQDLTSSETTWTAEPHVGETTFSGGEARWGTDYMHARYYKPIWGRFLSVDPSQRSARTEAPQSWNRYAYVQGNPIRAIDPNGENLYDVIGGIGNGLASSMVLAPRSSGNSDYRLGQQLGDIAALVVGALEGQSGAGIALGGVVAEGPTAGASTAAVVAGGALVVHGSVTIATAGKNIGQFFASKSEGGGASSGNMQKQVERDQAPGSIDRVDKGRAPGEQDNVHFAGGKDALNRDGTWKHGGRELTNKERQWLQKNGWTLPAAK